MSCWGQHFKDSMNKEWGREHTTQYSKRRNIVLSPVPSTCGSERQWGSKEPDRMRKTLPIYTGLASWQSTSQYGYKNSIKRWRPSILRAFAVDYWRQEAWRGSSFRNGTLSSGSWPTWRSRKRILASTKILSPFKSVFQHWETIQSKVDSPIKRGQQQIKSTHTGWRREHFKISKKESRPQETRTLLSMRLQKT